MSKHPHLLHLLATFGFFGVLMACGVDVLEIQVAHAASGGISQNVMSFAAVGASMIISILNFLMWVIFVALDIVLNPAFIFDYQAGPGLMNMLRNIWVLSRDMVNVGFAFMLIIGAVMSVIKADTSRIKELAPKFVMAIVLVNFSWFIPRVLFDVSQVLTYTVYQVPSLIGSGDCSIPFKEAGGAIVTKKCAVMVGAIFPPKAGKQVDHVALGAPFGWECPLPGLVCIETVPFDDPRAVGQGMHTQILNGLIVNHARLRTLATISDPTGGGVDPSKTDVRATLMFIVKLVMVLLIHIALFFPLLALVVALLLRIPVLWLTMAFMPFVALTYVVDIPGTGDFNIKEKIQNNFIKAVFMPVLVAVPLTVGFVLINAGANTAAPAGINKLETAIPFFTGITDYWQLLWLLICLFVLYTGTFMVLKGQSVIGGITETIEGFGKSMAQLAIKAPLAVPFIPAPGGGGAKQSVLEMGKKADPRNLLAGINASGRLDGGKPEQYSDVNAKALQKETVTNAKVNLEVKNVFNNPTGNAGQAGLNALVTELKKTRGLKGDDADIIEGLIKKRKEIGEALSAAEEKALRDALEEKKRRNAAPPAPAPTPTPPAPTPTPPPTI